MKEIVRIYVTDPKTGRDVAVTDPDKIVSALSNPKKEIDLDYNVGSNVKMGSSTDFIGETVRVGSMEIEIPAH